LPARPHAATRIGRRGGTDSGSFARLEWSRLRLASDSAGDGYWLVAMSRRRSTTVSFTVPATGIALRFRISMTPAGVGLQGTGRTLGWKGY